LLHCLGSTRYRPRARITNGCRQRTLTSFGLQGRL
jgi:hypothetical protein